MKVTIIGTGHIGGACAKGFVAASAAELTLTARSAETLRRYDSMPVRTTFDNREAVKGADIVFVAVKTACVQQVCDEIRDAIEPGQIVACMAAQVTPGQMLEYLTNSKGETPRLLYTIPNTAAEIRESVTFISDVSAGEDGVKLVQSLFDKVGCTMVVDREMLPAGISLASCGIGYAMKYMSAAVQGGMRLGFSEEEAMAAVCRTVKGAACLVSAHGTRPAEELRLVATPGGLTERGVNAMDAAGFTEAVCDGLLKSA